MIDLFSIGPREIVMAYIPRYIRPSFCFLALILIGVMAIAGVVKGGGKRGADPSEIRYGFIFHSTDPIALKRNRSLCSALSQELGREIKLVHVKNIREYGAGLAMGRLDLVCLGAAQYVKIRNISEPVVSQSSVDGTAKYHSILITVSSSPILKVEDGRGKVLAFGRRDSTSCTLIPTMHFIQDLKVTPAAFASQVVFAADNYDVVRGVHDGRYNVGATNNLDLALFCRTEKVDQDSFRILWTSANIPRGPYCVRKDLAAELKASIKKAFLAINNKPHVLKQIQVGGFVEVTDENYKIVRDALNYLNY
jgi:phosphonate transport system substrate-binding protein